MKKTLVPIFVFLLILLVPLADGCRDMSIQDDQKLLIPPKEISVQSYHELSLYLRNLNYNWRTAHQGVPSFVLAQLPEDLEQISQSSTKKRLFFLSLLPMALMINAEIETQRATLLDILDKLDTDRPISEEEVEFLHELASNYKIKEDPQNDPDARYKLLNRVDIVPPSLLLAQAANESAYGTSRFAQMANNLFGEWTFTPGTGLVPEDRPAGERYEVRLFPDLLASLKSYVNNLNTHWAYSDLRATRLKLRRRGDRLTGLALAPGLELYSERRHDYVNEIINIIRFNRLNQFNNATLRSTPVHQLYRQPKPTLLVDSDQ